MSRQSILQVAAAELGNIEHPASSNKTKYGAWYGLNGFAWCAMYVSWVYDQAGHPLGHIEDRRGFRSCQGGYRFWKANGRITRDPQPGDIVIYDWNGDGHCDHTGIFDSWVKPGNTFKAYEGNTAEGDDSNGGRVMLRLRNASSVKAFVSPLDLDGPAPQFDASLRRGDKGSRVTTLQKMLYDLKFDIVVDGDFGARTERALKHFQATHGLTADGIATAAIAGLLETAIRKKEAPDNKQTDGVYVKKGAAGAVVVALQKALNRKGTVAVAEDGVFGKDTVTALKAFQAKAGLTSDGVAGPQTFRALGIKNV